MPNIITHAFNATNVELAKLRAERETLLTLAEEAMCDAESTCRAFACEIEQTRDTERERGMEPTDRQVQIDTALHLAEIFALRDWRKRLELELSMKGTGL